MAAPEPSPTRGEWGCLGGILWAGGGMIGIAGAKTLSMYPAPLEGAPAASPSALDFALARALGVILLVCAAGVASVLWMPDATRPARDAWRLALQRVRLCAGATAAVCGLLAIGLLCEQGWREIAGGPKSGLTSGSTAGAATFGAVFAGTLWLFCDYWARAVARRDVATEALDPGPPTTALVAPPADAGEPASFPLGCWATLAMWRAVGLLFGGVLAARVVGLLGREDEWLKPTVSLVFLLGWLRWTTCRPPKADGP